VSRWYGARMSTFIVPATLIHPEHRGRSVEAELLVDTGATYILLPPDLVARLELSTPYEDSAMLASGEPVMYPLGEVRVRLAGRELTTVFWAGPPDCSAVLGAVALEQFSLAVDPRGQRLIPGPPALL
jgi:aspartyl protease family protein